jgi:integrase
MAEQDGLVNRNVAAIAEGPKMDHREGRTMTPAQARRFLAACRTQRLGAAYSLALFAGLRRGEVIGLQWSDIRIDGDQATVKIQRQLVRDKTGLHLVELKTKGSRRTLHLSAPLVEVLECHRGRQGAEKELRDNAWSNDWNLVFTSTYGMPLDPGEFGKGVSGITNEAELGHWSIHELRHTCASLLFSMNVPLDVVADQLGHASVGVTKDVYVHLLPGVSEVASRAMHELLYDDIDGVD